MKELRSKGERVKSDERILGGSDFVEPVLKKANEQWDRKVMCKERGVDLMGMIEKPGPHFSIDTEDLICGRKSRSVAKARAIVCYAAMYNLGLNFSSTAENK